MRWGAWPSFGGVQIHFVDHALEAVRRFPFSRHRSERIRKKLIKRFGAEFDMKPAVFEIRDADGQRRLVAHSSFEAKIRAELSERLDNHLREAIYGGWPS